MKTLKLGCILLALLLAGCAGTSANQAIPKEAPAVTVKADKAKVPCNTMNVRWGGSVYAGPDAFVLYRSDYDLGKLPLVTPDTQIQIQMKNEPQTFQLLEYVMDDQGTPQYGDPPAVLPFAFADQKGAFTLPDAPETEPFDEEAGVYLRGFKLVCGWDDDNVCEYVFALRWTAGE